MSGTELEQVVVGIDGSDQAERAALWAADEAVSRNAALRLIYVIRTDLSGTLAAAEYEIAVTTAKHALKSACDRIDEYRGAVTVSTAIAEGSPAAVLLAESDDADMLCVGWTGMNRIGIALMGSTAMTVADKAACPVAIVRARPEPAARESQLRWIITEVGTYSEDSCAVVNAAVAEARRRELPMLAVWTHAGNDKNCAGAVNRLASQWRQRYPDVHIYPVATCDGLAQFLHASPELGGLLIIEAGSYENVSSTLQEIGRAGGVDLAVVVVHNVKTGKTQTPSARRRMTLGLVNPLQTVRMERGRRVDVIVSLFTVRPDHRWHELAGPQLRGGPPRAGCASHESGSAPGCLPLWPESEGAARDRQAGAPTRRSVATRHVDVSNVATPEHLFSRTGLRHSRQLLSHRFHARSGSAPKVKCRPLIRVGSIRMNRGFAVAVQGRTCAFSARAISAPSSSSTAWP